ncbi:MAG: xanthine dehydrogenase family protein molybdopterin-binding subunit [Anaerolineae bacterium]|nr:xanthine dehydrogenase family protein molybdopterin-binding subunit [Anaerolineae bacterium]
MTDKTTNEKQKSTRKGVSRRRFLLILGGGVGALAVGAVAAGPTLVREGRLAMNTLFLTGDAPGTAPPKAPFVWFQIDADNTAHLYIPKIEMGQGIHTALAQVAADELDLAWETVRVHQGDAERGFDPALIFTFGSTSVTALYQPIREVAAALREMLRSEAAAQLNVAAERLVPVGSAFMVREEGGDNLLEPPITYGQVVAAKQGEWKTPETTSRLKTSAEFRYIGRSIERVDLRDKVTGRAVYGFDARVDGMKYGAVARPPRYGATLKRAAAGTAGSLPGVIAVVIRDGFAGVVAETRAKAHAALAALELEWEGGTNISQAEIEAMVSIPAQGGTLIQRVGDVEANGGGTRVEAAYRVPMASHAQLEPQAALAEVDGDSVTITTSTQSPEITRDRVAAALGIDAAKVRVVPAYIGGAFGRKTGIDVGAEAAILAKGAGVPVHVGWTREEDMMYGYKRPPAVNSLWASLDADGRVTAIHHELASADILLNPDIGAPILGRILGTDPLAAGGSLILYDFPNRRVVYHHTPIPVPTAYWRGLGSFPNTFAIETFMDELAAAAGTDPLDFRLRYKPEGALGDRFERVLNAVAEASGWRRTPTDGRARGLAAIYDRGTVCALVVEASVENGQIRVHRAWCAVDPGLVINPDGAANQVQGSIIMGLSSTLKERFTVENGMAAAQNFNAYPLLTLAEAPTIEVIAINSGDEPVGGLGEPVVGLVPAAVSSAIFALTGERLRELPFTLA